MEVEMGRGKLNMELIRKEKSRNTTFKKRKEGLFRKIHEFTTLCDVSACMIIYGPKKEVSGVEPEVWPENEEVVRHLIDIYRHKSKDSGSCRVYGLGDFYDDRKKRMEDELEKLRKKNMEYKFPTWFDFLSFFSEKQLRSLAGGLCHKLEIVKNRIESIKGSVKQNQNQCLNNQNQCLNEGSQQDMMIAKAHPFPPSLIQRGIELDLMTQQGISGGQPIETLVPIPYPTIDQEHQMHSIDQNSMMMMLMNDNDHHFHHHRLQFGGATGCNVQHTAFKHQVFFESTAGGVDNMVYDNNAVYNKPRPLTRYYAHTLQPLQAPFVRFPVRPMAPPPPQLLFSRENIEGGKALSSIPARDLSSLR